MKRIRERDLEDDGQRKVMVKGRRAPKKLDTNGTSPTPQDGTGQAIAKALVASQKQTGRLAKELEDAKAAVKKLRAAVGTDSASADLIESVEQELDEAIAESRKQRERADATLAGLADVQAALDETISESGKQRKRADSALAELADAQAVLETEKDEGSMARQALDKATTTMANWDTKAKKAQQATEATLTSVQKQLAQTTKDRTPQAPSWRQLLLRSA